MTFREASDEALRRFGQTPEEIKKSKQFADAEVPQGIAFGKTHIAPGHEEFVIGLLLSISTGAFNPDADALGDLLLQHALRGDHPQRN